MPAGGPWNKIITLHTCGKALGVMGAVVCGTAQVVDFLVNRARPFIYATAPSPLMAVAVMAALDIVQSQPERRKRLQSLVQLANSGLARVCGRGGSGSQIIPIMVGRDSAALSLANALQTRGFDIRAIRPPTVPEGTARLRMSVTLNVSEDDVRALLSALGEELERLAA
jgi:8-amino-7-oxononanoate synthase